MDKLFTYDTPDMVKKLNSVEAEMREDSYHDWDIKLLQTSKNAMDYIQSLIAYVKKYYQPNKCTILSVLKELYRIASTGEYMYLQEIDDIGYANEVFERMKGESGYEEVLYAARLLRYYYMIKEKKHSSGSVWKEIESIYKKVSELGPLKKIEKKEKNISDKQELSETEFMTALYNHMNKNMIGQSTLKKKLCSALYQFKYHDVRTTLLMVGPSGSGKNHMIDTIRTFPELGYPVISYDCSALTPNGFNGADANDIFKKVRRLISKPSMMRTMRGNANSDKCIVYLDEIDKIINFNHDSRGESVNAMVQQQLLSSLAGTETIEGIDTSKILFILGGAFPRIDELKISKDKKPVGFNINSECKIDYKESLRDQIIAIGGEVEFVGRIEEIVKMSKLTRADLKAILMDENIGVFTKKQEIYEASGLKLEMEEDTIDAIVDLIEKEAAGARSVKNIMNQFADSLYFYDMKVNGYDTMRIHKGMLNGEEPKFYRGGKCFG